MIRLEARNGQRVQRVIGNKVRILEAQVRGLTPQQLMLALGTQRQVNRQLGTILIEQGLVSADDIKKFLKS